MPPQYSTLSQLRRTFGTGLRLDEKLRTAARELDERGVMRKQIIGPAPEPANGPFYASPSRLVFHRPRCKWAAEIGAELLIIQTAKAARGLKCRPCRVCRPLDATSRDAAPVDRRSHQEPAGVAARRPRPTVTVKEQMAERFSRHRIRSTAPLPTARRLGLPPVQLADDET